MKFENEALKTSFELPDKLSARQRLAYKTAVALAPADDSVFARAWLGVRLLVQNWKSEHIPDPAALDLDAGCENDEVVTDVIMWAVNQTIDHLSPAGGNVPKN